MRIPIFQVDAFANDLFAGNPAAICVLDEAISAELMQSIAMENNLSETAYIWPLDEDAAHWHIRWFTPSCEVDLCGHATLASAHVLFSHLGVSGQRVRFESTVHGVLTVDREGPWLTLNFPTDSPIAVEKPAGLSEALGAEVCEVRKGRDDYLVLLANEDSVRVLNPDLGYIKGLPARGLMVTAPGESVDFVSRFFGPGSGIDEDPVTGSAHTTLTAYWSEKLRKTTFTARQLSARGGDLRCELRGDRVLISGQAVTYLKGQIGRLD
ncbi:MAG: PhzF family phenazine biosynthesis protein [Ketobacter sp.]